jgi:hypothetical protein
MISIRYVVWQVSGDRGAGCHPGTAPLADTQCASLRSPIELDHVDQPVPVATFHADVGGGHYHHPLRLSGDTCALFWGRTAGSSEEGG